ncbi:MAG: hypothetical protein DWG76_02280 [Chloroflexi bacterium]|nr:hypothetical protein [Chloroflexota bacterium]
MAVAPNSQPNIAVIVIDCGRADHFSAYGYYRKTTPFMEILAREGRLFRQAYSVATSTPLSHFALLTGQPDWGGRAWIRESNLFSRLKYYAQRVLRLIGLTDYVAGYRHDRHSILALLNGAGYRTIGISANQLVSPETIEAYSDFSTFLNQALFEGIDSPSVNQKLRAYGLRDSVANRNAVHATADRVFKLVFEAIRNDDEADREPFFLFANLMDCHDPYIVPPEVSEDFNFTPTSDFNGDLRNRPSLAKTGQKTHWKEISDLDQDTIELLRWNYDRCLYYVDSQIMHFSRMLNEIGELNNTVFIILADHSELLGEHGYFTHSLPEFTELAHIPLLVFGPKDLIIPGEVNEKVSILDVRPTILEIAKITDTFLETTGHSLIKTHQTSMSSRQTTLESKGYELGLTREGLSAEQTEIVEQRLRDMGYLD